MARFLADRSIDPTGVTVYGFGGAGPVHFARACSIAGIRRMRTFPYGAVFSAFGCTAVDVRHRYEVLVPTGGFSRDAACAALDQLLRRAGWDLKAEGFGDRGGICQLVAEGVDGREEARTAERPFEASAAQSLVDAAWPLPPDASTLALVVDVPIGARAAVPSSTLTRAGGASPVGGGRTIWWGGEPTSARVLGIGDLPAGAPAPGPLVVLDGEAVCVVPPDWSVTREPDGGLFWQRSLDRRS
jgi:N-methylhydantoinase A/oxoprolinase/acetone carboxylase beta subunit